MLKDSEGVFERELATLHLAADAEYLERAYAQEEDGRVELRVTLSTAGREVSDEAYNASLDYYDAEIFAPLGAKARELEDYNPSWEVALPYCGGVPEMERRLARILALHKAELKSIFQIMEEEYK
jgi:DNA-binding XRE family transcriptional regulator